MSKWRLFLPCCAGLCSTAQAEPVRAVLAVSVTVLDQCVVRPAAQAATCTGGAAYDVGVTRERLTVDDEHAHTFRYEQRGPTSGTGGDDDASPPTMGDLAQGSLQRVGSASEAGGSFEAARVTYSF